MLTVECIITTRSALGCRFDCVSFVIVRNYFKSGFSAVKVESTANEGRAGGCSNDEKTKCRPGDLIRVEASRRSSVPNITKFLIGHQQLRVPSDVTVVNTRSVRVNVSTGTCPIQ